MNNLGSRVTEWKLTESNIHLWKESKALADEEISGYKKSSFEGMKMTAKRFAGYIPVPVYYNFIPLLQYIDEEFLSVGFLVISK